MALMCKIFGHKRKLGSFYRGKNNYVQEAWCSRCGKDMKVITPYGLMNRQSPPDTIEGFRGQ